MLSLYPPTPTATLNSTWVQVRHAAVLYFRGVRLPLPSLWQSACAGCLLSNLPTCVCVCVCVCVRACVCVCVCVVKWIPKSSSASRSMLHLYKMPLHVRGHTCTHTCVRALTQPASLSPFFLAPDRQTQLEIPHGEL